MKSKMEFDYFYGGESEQFSFFRIPRQLVTGPEFRHLSTDAKLLYGLLLDRMSLSAKNGWYDQRGRVYIFYTVNDIRQDLDCGNDKALKLLAELDSDKGVGLIERVKQGQGKPTRIYVKRFTTRKVPPCPAPEPKNPDIGFSDFKTSDRADFLTSEKPTSRHREIRGQDIGFSDPNYTELNKTDRNQTDLSINRDGWIDR